MIITKAKSKDNGLQIESVKEWTSKQPAPTELKPR